MKKLVLFLAALLAIGGSTFAQTIVPIVGGVVTADVGRNSTFKVIVSATVTSVVLTSSQTPAAGQIVTIFFTENSTGGFAVTFGGNISNACTVTTTANATTNCQFQFNGTDGTWYGLGSSSSSGTSQGPVINVTNTSYAGGASSSNADNNAQFTAAVAAVNANPSVSPPTAIATPVGATNNGVTVTSVQVTITMPANSTNFVLVSDAVALHTMAITDSGGSSYFQQGTTLSNAAFGTLRLFSTPPGAGKSSTTVTATTTTGAENITVAVVSYPSGVASIQNPITSTTLTNASVSLSQTTLKVASTMLAGCNFYNNNAATFSATTGTVRATIASNTNNGGELLMDNSSIPIASVTNAGTASATTNYGCIQIELQTNGAGNQVPTLYIPQGYYNYSGGLSLTQPATLKCEPGAILNYTGSAHAVDFGPNNLTSANPQWPYYLDGCTFTGGSNMTQGVFLNGFVIIAGIRNTYFHNFGPPSTGVSSGHMLAAQCDNWDIEVGPQVRVITDDYIPRNFYRPNLGACDSTSFSRVHDIEMYCLNGIAGSLNGGCPANQAGIGLHLDSAENIVSHNSMAFFNPDILVACSVIPCLGTVIDNNLINNPNGAGTGTLLPPIQFQSSNDGLVIQHNRFDMHFTSAVSPIGPRGGSDTALGFRVNFNTFDEFTGQASIPVLQLNNIAGQTNNQSSNNLCSVNYGPTFIPCPIAHTTGSNIGNFTFNVDDQHVAGLYATTTNCSSSAGTCVASPAGAVSIAAAASTVTVTTTAVTANSQIILSRDDTLGTKLGVTCNTATAAGDIKVSTRTAATSFVITVQNAPVTNPLCLNYWIVN